MSFIDDVVAGRVALPMVPQVVEKVMTAMRRPDVSFAAISAELEQDPVMSSRVLRLANSSFFSGRRQIASIDDAISVIGLKSLQNLVIACGAMAAFADVPTVNLRQFWMASVMTATAGRQIALRMDVDADAAYCAGLLQGVGHLILCQCHPALAAEAFGSYQVLWGQRLAALEDAAFGLAHPAISALWVDQMHLPTEVVEAVRHSLDSLDAPAPRLGRTVQLAASVAASVAEGLTVAQAIERMDHNLVALLALETYVGGDRFATDFADLQQLPSPL